MLRQQLKDFGILFLQFFKELLLVRWILHLFRNKAFVVVLVVVLLGAFLHRHGVSDWFNDYMAEYERLNSEEGEDEEAGEGMQFVEIDQGLYVMSGGIEEGDCNRILQDMPVEEHFTVILESPGGNLAEGSCLAAHLKLRNVITVVRDTPVYNELNEIIYQPGLIGAEDRENDNVVCASACGLLFLAGDARYLIGDVFLGIHGPATQAENGPKNPQQAEAAMLQTASKLLDLLEELGIEDPDTRQLFIQIPSYTMYWLRPSEFHLREGLITMATHYRNFWGFTATNHAGTM